EQSDDRAVAFIFDDVVSRRTMCRQMIHMMSRGKPTSIGRLSTLESWQAAEANLSKELEELQKQHGKRKISWPPIEQRALKGDSEELYVSPFWLFSQDDHLIPVLHSYAAFSSGSGSAVVASVIQSQPHRRRTRA